MTTDMEPYPKDKLRAVEKSLTASGKKLVKAGIIISQGEWTIFGIMDNRKTYPPMPNWGTEKGKCCIISAYLLDKQPEIAITFGQSTQDKAIASACAALDSSYEFISGIVYGFDSAYTYVEAEKFLYKDNYRPQKIQGFELGLKLGKKFLVK